MKVPRVSNIPLEKVKKIVLIRIGKIGDLILTDFALRKIRKTLAEARIMMVTLARNRELLRYAKHIDQIVFIRGGLSLPGLILRLRLFHADLMLDFNDNPSSTSTILARFGGARYRVGFSLSPNATFLTLPVECPPRESTHITERLQKIPEAIGLQFEPSEVVPYVYIGEAERADAAALLRRVAGDRPVVAVNVSAGHPSRYWQVEKWNAFLKQAALKEQQCLFMILRAPNDTIDVDRIVEGLPGDRIFRANETGFHSFAAYISLSRLLVSPDTAAVHIASAFKVPVLGLYPAVHWNLVSWHPIGTEYDAVTPSSGLVPDIEVEAVVRSFHTLTGRIGGL